MSWLAPWFLLGLSALAIPLALHLIRRTPRGRQLFSTLMFLRPSPPRLQRRSRLDHLLLLLLRLAVILLLVAAFTRPFLRRQAHHVAEDPQRLVALLIDTSASMQRPGIWGAVQQAAEQVFATLRPSDDVALFAFHRQLVTLVPPGSGESNNSETLAALRLQLRQLKPGWGQTDLGLALVSAVEQLESVAGQRQIELVVISDFQAGANLDALQGYEWPQHLRLETRQIEATARSNASVRVLQLDEEQAGSSGQVALRVYNDVQSERDQFTLVWKRQQQPLSDIAPVRVQVPAGGTRVVQVQRPPEADSIELLGDDCDFDNIYYIGERPRQKVTVLYVGRDTADDHQGLAYFLARAVADLAGLDCSVVPCLPAQGMDQMHELAPDVVVVAAPLAPDIQTALVDFRQQGGTVLIVLDSHTQPRALAELLGDELEPAESAVQANRSAGRMLEWLDLAHPLLNRFADPRYSDFTKIRFWKHWPVKLADNADRHLLARFDNGDPFLWHQRYGSGQQLVMTAGWQPEEGQLALSTKFVPLLAGVVELATQGPTLPSHWIAGQPVLLAQLGAGQNTPGHLRMPDGTEVRMDPQQRWVELPQPGIYQVQWGDTVHRLAVNLYEQESRTAAEAVQQLARLGVPTADALADAPQLQRRQLQLQQEELENRQRLWQWLLAGALVGILAESFVAGRSSAASRSVEEGTMA